MKKYSLNNILNCVLFLCFTSSIFAQISFSDATSLFNTDIKSGIAIAIADMNNDGLDDLIRLDEKRFLYVEYQGSNGQFLEKYYGEIDGEAWSICIADIDNDGYNDIATGGFYDKLKILTYQPNSDSFLRSELEELIFLQGSNFIDINQDGWVDYFACHDDGSSNPYRNTGVDSFSLDYNLIETRTGDEIMDSGNYGSVWTDFDNDGDIDLYVSKCRLGVDNPNDPRRVNQMYINDGNNQFIEGAAQIGLTPLGQSWATDFADIDNDGDLDAFIVNHDILSVLYLNDGSGNYSPAPTQIDPKILQELISIFQLKFTDLDNDGYVDLILAADSGKATILFNTGNGTFGKIENALPDNEEASSFSTGDLNNDGLIDMVCSYSVSINGPTTKSDKIFINEFTNNNNYIKVRLKGMVSNANGIGSRITIYSNLGQQIREIRSGESYGTMHSMTAHFGVGSDLVIDSIHVSWPSGNKQVVYNQVVNQTLNITEDVDCLEQITNLNQSICEGDSILFAGNLLYAPGIYCDTILSSLECDSIIKLQLDFFTENTTVQDLLLCNGDSVLINGQSILNDTTITDTLITINGCDSIVLYQINFTEPLQLAIDYLICSEDSILISGGYYYAGDAFVEMLTDQYGCDSIVYHAIAGYDQEVILSTTYNAIYTDLTGNWEYQWFECDGNNLNPIPNANTDSLIIDVSGSYALQATDINSGCTFESECLDFIISNIGENVINIQLYPNPAYNQLVIKSENAQIKSISIYSIDGKTHNLTLSDQNVFDISDLSAGLYWVSVEYDGGVFLEQFVKG